jgi:methylenetetrahydrofolate dehydrogenase (NADP+) / methenyltetrahydrofolate cyclohydrolase / formyltetrahydrofolate synthetase
MKAALENGAFRAVVSHHWSEGGAGAVDAAEAVIAACEEKTAFKFLYNLYLPIEDKIFRIAEKMYGCGSVDYSPKAKESIRNFTQQVREFLNKLMIFFYYFLYLFQGFDKLPICMSKTALSLTGDPNIKGAPKGFKLT